LMPRRHPQARRLESSVCRSAGMPNKEVFDICATHFDPFSKAPAIGRGAGKVKVVLYVGLQLEADGVPYQQHANIIGWFDSAVQPDEQMKHHWMSHAKQMAPAVRYIER
jgi:hypothetical protein